MFSRGLKETAGPRRRPGRPLAVARSIISYGLRVLRPHGIIRRGDAILALIHIGRAAGGAWEVIGQDRPGGGGRTGAGGRIRNGGRGRSRCARGSRRRRGRGRSSWGSGRGKRRPRGLGWRCRSIRRHWGRGHRGARGRGKGRSRSRRPEGIRADSSPGPLVEKASGWLLNTEGGKGSIPYPRRRKASRATGAAPPLLNLRKTFSIYMIAHRRIPYGFLSPAGSIEADMCGPHTRFGRWFQPHAGSIEAAWVSRWRW